VAAWFKAWVYYRSLAAIGGSNPGGSIDVFGEDFVLYGKRSLRRVDLSSRGVLPSAAFLSVIEKLRTGGLGPLGTVKPTNKFSTAAVFVIAILKCGLYGIYNYIQNSVYNI
jgi:hypothetical protein